MVQAASENRMFDYLPVKGNGGFYAAYSIFPQGAFHGRQHLFPGFAIGNEQSGSRIIMAGKFIAAGNTGINAHTLPGLRFVRR